MTRDELKGKQTPGKWVVIGTEIVNEANTSTVCVTFGGHGGQGREANIALIAEAGTVANRTGMWPEDLVAMLASCYRASGADPDGDEDWMLAPNALRAVNDLAKSYNDACEEASAFEVKAKKLEQRVKELEEALSKARAYIHQSQLDTAMGWTGDYEVGLQHAGNYFLVREIDAILNKKPA